MDPVSAVGIAAASLQFLDFGLTVLKTFQEIHNAADGATARNAEFEKQALLLRNVDRDLEQAMAKNSTANSRIMNLAIECQKSSQDLSNLLTQIRGSNTKSTRNTVKATLRAIKEQPNVAKLKSRLEYHQRQLHDAMMPEILMRISEVPHEISRGLTNVQQQLLDDLKKAHDSETALKMIRHAQVKNEIQQGTDTIMTAIKYSHQDLLMVIRNGLANQQTRDRAPDIQDSIHQSLHHPKFDSYKARIQPAHPGTFEWIFDHPFADWLKNSNDSYWIGGRACSGKTTLMEYLIKHDQTHCLLDDWSCFEPVYLITHFFWRGTPMERSITGFAQSILYQLCKVVPGAKKLVARLIPSDHVFSANDEPFPWKKSTLLEALGGVLSLRSETFFCFFIDGLDEYHGDLKELTSLVSRIQDHAHTKVCISSSLKPPSQANLDPNVTCLWLEELTHTDIRLLVKERLRIYHEGSLVEGVISAVIHGAKGMFSLALARADSMIEGQNRGESLEWQRHRLDNVTYPQFDHIFANMLSRIRKENYDSLAILIRTLMVQCRLGLPPLTVAMAMVIWRKFSVANYEELLAIPEFLLSIAEQSCGLITSDLPFTSYYWDRNLSRNVQDHFGDLAYQKDFVCLKYADSDRGSANSSSVRFIDDAPTQLSDLLIAQVVPIDWLNSSAYQYVESQRSKSNIISYAEYHIPQATVLETLLEAYIELYALTPRSSRANEIVVLSADVWYDDFDRADFPKDPVFGTYYLKQIERHLDTTTCHKFLDNLREAVRGTYVHGRHCSWVHLHPLEPVWFWVACIEHHVQSGPGYLLSVLDKHDSTLDARGRRCYADMAKELLGWARLPGCLPKNENEHLLNAVLTLLSRLYKHDMKLSSTVWPIESPAANDPQMYSTVHGSYRLKLCCSRSFHQATSRYDWLRDYLVNLRHPLGRELLTTDFVNRRSELCNLMLRCMDMSACCWGIYHKDCEEPYWNPWSRNKNEPVFHIMFNIGVWIALFEQTLHQPREQINTADTRLIWDALESRICKPDPMLRVLLFMKNIGWLAFDIRPSTTRKILENAQIVGLDMVTEVFSKARGSKSTHLGGSLEQLELCRQLLLYDVLANRNNQLTPSALLYAIFCIRTKLDQSWHINCDCEGRIKLPLFEPNPSAGEAKATFLTPREAQIRLKTIERTLKYFYKPLRIRRTRSTCMVLRKGCKWTLKYISQPLRIRRTRTTRISRRQSFIKTNIAPRDATDLECSTVGELSPPKQSWWPSKLLGGGIRNRGMPVHMVDKEEMKAKIKRQHFFQSFSDPDHVIRRTPSETRQYDFR